MDKYTIPPSTLRTIGDELLENNVSWKYYGEGWNLFVNDPEDQNPLNRDCDIGNWTVLRRRPTGICLKASSAIS